MAKSSSLPISSVNHISLLCSSVEKSAAFYEEVLGFFPIKRPGSFDFDGAWLFNYGMGIHLIRAPNPSELPTKSEINPKDNHMSFQTGCQDIGEVEERLRELGVRYIRVEVEEGGIRVDQIFFHDPDGFMIEVCTCDNLPLVPLRHHHVPASDHLISSTTSSASTSSIISTSSMPASANVQVMLTGGHAGSCSNRMLNACSLQHYTNHGRCTATCCLTAATAGASACANQQLAGATSL